MAIVSANVRTRFRSYRALECCFRIPRATDSAPAHCPFPRASFTLRTCWEGKGVCPAATVLPASSNLSASTRSLISSYEGGRDWSAGLPGKRARSVFSRKEALPGALLEQRALRRRTGLLKS